MTEQDNTQGNNNIEKLQEQIDDLQEKLLFQEDTIQKLDEVVCKQYQLIDLANRKVKELEEQIFNLQDELEKGVAGKDNEKPPHY